ncbi:DUF3347 domain-containing protein, partial [Xanthovirga aplysinae]|uniref:DUF3347 domain-containing protein n=1 Tax=Xanthovirga aplysinae TaxID=2529853 RepID=UPI0012BC2007
ASFAQSSSSFDVVLKNYLNVKNALVATNGAKAQAAAKELMASLKSYQNENHAEALAQIKTSTEHISGTSDVEHQRKHLNALSEGMYNLSAAFDLVGSEVYLQYCPMAQNGGAYWLSAEKEVKNPYYGSKMLKCGTVKNKM